MTTETAIATAFRPFAEEVAAWYEGRIRKLFEKAKDADGNVFGAYREPRIQPGETREEFFARRPRYEAAKACARYLRGDGRMSSPRYLAEEFLLTSAAKFGEEQVAGFIAKLERKLEALENVEARVSGAGEFEITGTRDGSKVYVEQRAVFKTSNRGTFFIQWPARIYVDGKFTPEKEFKERFVAA